MEAIFPLGMWYQIQVLSLQKCPFERHLFYKIMTFLSFS